jgi:hypothetical protein
MKRVKIIVDNKVTKEYREREFKIKKKWYQFLVPPIGIHWKLTGKYPKPEAFLYGKNLLINKAMDFLINDIKELDLPDPVCIKMCGRLAYRAKGFRTENYCVYVTDHVLGQVRK